MESRTPAREAASEHVLLVLEQPDCMALASDLKQQGYSFESRHQIIEEELRAVAKSTQKPLITALSDLENSGAIHSFKPFYIANVIAVECPPESITLLAALPGVLRIDDDLPLALIQPEDPQAAGRGEGRNELDEASEGLLRIRADEVWNLGISGSGVLLANLDSGVDGDHPALAGRWRGDLGEPAGECWLDLVEPFTDTPQGNGSHGTMTMGIMCGAEAGDTIGVAWGAQYIAAQIDFGLGLMSDALEAFEWMLDPDGNPETISDVPRVISNSWGLLAGSDPCNNIFYAAIDNCEAAGIAVVWAAGNEGPGIGTIRNPASRAINEFSSFAVGGYDNLTGDVWASSSRGPSACTTDSILQIKPEVMAPARNIRSSGLNGGYYIGSGTSFAAPHVAGTMALMLEANPMLDPDSLKELLMLTAVDYGDRGSDNTYGSGLLDAYWAVFAALSGIGWIEGYITDEIGTPVETVIYLPDHPHTFASDENGFFRFAIPAWWPIDIQVVVPGYYVYSAQVLAFPDSTIFQDIDLVFSSNGTLTGTVIDCEGLPAAGAIVQVLNNPFPMDIADANGRFLFSLPAGFYDVMASSEMCGQTLVEAIQVVAGGVTDIEIVLPLNPNFVCSDPDDNGYKICDNNDPGGPEFEWTEIAPAEGGDGVTLNLYDDESQEILLPFPATFYGIDYQSLFINANGTISFGTPLSNWYNLPIPAEIAPAVFCLWDDFDDTIENLQGGILVQHKPEEGAVIIEWYQVPRYRPPPQFPNQGRATFQVVIHDRELLGTVSGNSVIEVMYGEVDSTESCTIGIEADSESNYVRHLYNGDYEAHASPLVHGLALRFADELEPPLVPQMSILPSLIELMLAPGESVDTSLTLFSTGSGPVGYRVSFTSEQYSSPVSWKMTDSSAWTPPDGYVGKDSTPELPKGSTSPRPARSSSLDSGEVDQNGYAWVDSRDEGGPEFEFPDISSVGVDLGLVEDDTSSGPIELPWDFEFYGRTFRKFTVNTNGFLSFLSLYPSWQNRSLSAQPFTDPFLMVAPFWIDLDPRLGGAIYTYYDEEDERVIVMWEEIERYGSQGGPSTFAVALYPDGTIEFSYDEMTSSPLTSTVGIKGADSSEVRQLSFWTSFIEDDLQVRIYRPDTTEASCRILDNSFGVIPAGGSVAVPIRLTNNLLASGSRIWPLTVASTDPQFSNQLVNIFLISPGEIDAQLVARKDGDDVTLHWRSFPTPHYCVYSGNPDDEELLRFEGMTSDTFFTIVDPAESTRIYEIRLCAGAAGAGEGD